MVKQFSVKENLVFSNGPKSLSKKFLDCTVLYSGVFDNFVLADELFAKDF